METDIKQKPPVLKLFLGAVLGCIGCISALLVINYSLPYISAVVFPDGADAAMSMTRQLVTALRTDNIEKVNNLIDDPTQGSQIMNDIAVLSNEDAIIKYEDLLICESTAKGDIWENVGVIYYGDTSVRFEVELMQDTNKTWKFHRFMLLPEDGPGANFGWCQ